MRVVVDLQACQGQSRTRGIGRYSMSLARALAAQAGDHEVWVALNAGLPDRIDEIRGTFLQWLPSSRIVSFSHPNPVKLRDSANGWRGRASELIRESFLAGLQPDLVHTSTVFEGWDDDLVIGGYSRKSFVDSATLYDLIPLLSPLSYLREERVRAAYHRRLETLQRADLVLAISEHTRREAIRALKLPEERVVNISVAHDPIFHERRPTDGRREQLMARVGLRKPFLMYTGGIDARKNIEGLVQAFALLPRDLQDAFQLAVVCKVREEDRVHLRAVAARHGLPGDALVVTGFVPDEDLVDLYNCTSLFVFPSLEEGAGLPVLEAMACGAPVIASDTSSLTELIELPGARFDPFSPGEISACMERVLGDAGLRRRLSDYGRERVRDFSWEATAKRAWEAFEAAHSRRLRSQPAAARAKSSRPRLAFVSPLPPARSGVASYSSQLLPVLSERYEIEVVVDQPAVSDEWAQSNTPIHTVDWFRRNHHRFDHVLYQFGNSTFHKHMFELLRLCPGVVMLHDFYLSGALAGVNSPAPGATAFDRALVHSHGFGALFDARVEGRDAAIRRFPANRDVIDHATGVLVHSEHSAQLGREWYGADAVRDWRVIPQLRSEPPSADRQAARRQLGLGTDDFLVCSFGFLAPTKLNDRAFDGWIGSALAADESCRMVFVGESPSDRFGDTLARRIVGSPSAGVSVTGFVSQELYHRYLAAADVAIQLRADSRGETSRAVLDCLASGVPVIVNLHGWASELPDGTAVKLPEDFADAELSAALTRLRTDETLRAVLRQGALDYVRRELDPYRVARLYEEAIEEFARYSTAGDRYRLARQIGQIEPPPEDSRDFASAARCVALNRATSQPPRILIDLTDLGPAAPHDRLDKRTPAHELAAALLSLDTSGVCRVVPVRSDAGGYRVAWRGACDLLGVGAREGADEVVDLGRGDTLLIPATTGTTDSERFARWRHGGVEVVLVDSTEGHSFPPGLPAAADGVVVASEQELRMLASSIAGSNAGTRPPLRAASLTTTGPPQVAGPVTAWVESAQRIVEIVAGGKWAESLAFSSD